MTNIIIYLCAINIMTFLLYGLDKQRRNATNGESLKRHF